MSKEILAGIDLGGTNIKIGCFDSGLRLLARDSVPTEAHMSAKVVVDQLGAAVNRLVQGLGKGARLVAAGIGSPGPADYKKGIIFQCANLPTFKDVPLPQMLSERLHCPVAFDNDANVACYGEFVAGAGKDVQDMVFFTLGTGIGCGIVSNGRLIQGATGNAAEVGHMIIFRDGRQCNCGQRGCVEAYASASSTARRAMEAIQAGRPSSLKGLLEEKGQITSKDVYEHLAAGDMLAKQITDETARALAIMCVNILHTTDPARIVFSGGMIAAGQVLLDRIRYYFQQEIWRLKKETVEIVFASLGEDAGIVGAAAMAKEKIGL
ncbi:MAG: ROK family protein [Sedimentisphaerales bacterium]|nr:ROK family protein [Sedimentisphaerales bacterium]